MAFLGEGPGYQEDRYGRPFVGPTGDLLDELLAGIGLRRHDVYLMNATNCLAPRAREPRLDELEQCSFWVWEQIYALPELKVVVALGRYAALTLCPGEKPSNLRGSARAVDGRVEFYSLHPAAALHNPDMRPELDREFSLIGTLL